MTVVPAANRQSMLTSARLLAVSFFRRLMMSPILIGLLSVLVLWLAIFQGRGPKELTGPPPGWKPPPPRHAGRNLAFEQRMDIGNLAATEQLAAPPHKEEEVIGEVALANAIHGYNTRASERIGPRIRQLPPTSPEICRKSDTHERHIKLPSVDIIITFHNEHFTTLARTILSVLHRTPEQLLGNVILVDDGSELSNNDELNDFLAKSLVVKTKLIRLDRHIGIAGARLAGARASITENAVLVFMESHAEPNDDWLEPLLTLIAASDKSTPVIAVPVIDIIDDETFAYRESPAIRGGFDWDLLFRWEFAGDATMDSLNGIPFIQTPAFSGGVFAVDRATFFEMGGYDEEMKQWGAENVEMSLRFGMCRNGRVLVTPCSRVGHVFRRRPPATVNMEADEADPNYWFAHNALRTAAVWLWDTSPDDGTLYMRHFFAAIPEARRMKLGDVSARIELRQKLGCTKFSTFLQKIYPDHPKPPQATVNEGQGHQVGIDVPQQDLTSNVNAGNAGKNDVASRLHRTGQLFHAISELCVVPSTGRLEAPAGVLPAESLEFRCVTLAQCEKNSPNQRWFETKFGELRHEASETCLTWSAAYSPAVLLARCKIDHPEASNSIVVPASQKWRWLDDIRSPQLQLVVPGSALSERCLVGRDHSQLEIGCRHSEVNCTKPDEVDKLQKKILPPKVKSVCNGATGDPFEVILEACTTDYNQHFALIESP